MKAGVTQLIILLALGISCHDASMQGKYPANILADLAESGTFATWIYTPIISNSTSPGVREGTAYIDCSRLKKNTLLGEVSLSTLTFTINIWGHGMREHTTFNFTYMNQGNSTESTLVTVKSTSWHFLSTYGNHLYDVEFDELKITLTDEAGEYVLTGPLARASSLWMLGAAAIISCLLFNAMAGGDYEYQQKMLQPLARTILSGKLIGLVAVIAWTAAVANAYLLLIGSVVIGLFVLLLGFIVSGTIVGPATFQAHWTSLLAVFSFSEVAMFGIVEYQLATVLFLLVLQIYHKYSIPKIDNTNKEDRKFVTFLVVWVAFNGPWLHFQENFYMVQPPAITPQGLAAVVAILLFVLPR